MEMFVVWFAPVLIVNLLLILLIGVEDIKEGYRIDKWFTITFFSLFLLASICWFGWIALKAYNL